MTVLPDATRVRPDTSPIERIRTAAMKSFATQGFANTSLRAVAAAAGVSLELVQHHFATKDGLIKAVDDHVLTVVITHITQEIPAGTRDSVAEIGDRVTRMIAEMPDIVDYIAYSITNNPFSILVMLCFGVVGFVMMENDFPVAPAILGIVLGPMLEQNFFNSMIKADGDLLAFFSRPIAASLGALFILLWLLPLVSLLRQRRHAPAE